MIVLASIAAISRGLFEIVPVGSRERCLQKFPASCRGDVDSGRDLVDEHLHVSTISACDWTFGLGGKLGERDDLREAGRQQPQVVSEPDVGDIRAADPDDHPMDVRCRILHGLPGRRRVVECSDRSYAHRLHARQHSSDSHQPCLSVCHVSAPLSTHGRSVLPPPDPNGDKDCSDRSPGLHPRCTFGSIQTEIEANAGLPDVHGEMLPSTFGAPV